MTEKRRSRREQELARELNDPRRIRRERIVREAEKITRKADEEKRRRG